MTDNQMILLSITLTLAERIRGVGLIQTGGFSVQRYSLILGLRGKNDNNVKHLLGVFLLKF